MRKKQFTPLSFQVERFLRNPGLREEALGQG